MSSTESVPAHSHEGGKCPITGATGANPHAFCPPQEGDLRAPCPAMNSMANHGYLPRDGRMINADVIIDALMRCFRLSKPLAWFLTHGALTLLDQGSGNFQLSDLARHNHVEHNASLYHPDAGPRDEYAPIHGDPDLLELVFKDSESGVVMTPEDIARVRVRRELTSNPPLDFIHAELARGEIAIVLNMFNNPNAKLHESKNVPLFKRSVFSKVWRALLRRKDSPQTTPLDGVPIERMRYWFEHERLPEDWEPYHTTTLMQTVNTVNRIRSKMHELERQNKRKAKVQKKITAAPEKTLGPAAVAVVEPAVKLEGQVSAPASSGESASDSEVDDGNTLTVPPLIHSRDSSASSATSSTFSDLPRTPQSSEFTPPSVTTPWTKDTRMFELRMPDILENTELASKDVERSVSNPVVEVAAT